MYPAFVQVASPVATLVSKFRFHGNKKQETK
jgi:hypothetical protein